jgi:hypothetical protein
MLPDKTFTPRPTFPLVLLLVVCPVRDSPHSRHALACFSRKPGWVLSTQLRLDIIALSSLPHQDS